MASPLTGLLENLEVLAEHTRVRLLNFRRALPPEPIRAMFDSGPQEALALAVRLRLQGDTPFGYYTSWTRTEHPAFDEAGLSHSSRLKLFDVAGIQFKQVEQVLSAVNADAISAMHLEVEPGTALLSLERLSYDSEGNLVDLLNVLYRPDQFTYRMKLDLDVA